MASLSIRYKGEQTETTEYGYPMQGVSSFQCLVPEDLHGNNKELALALVRNDTRLTSAASVTVRLSQKLQNGDYVVTGTRTKLNKARSQDNFRFQFRGGLTSTETATDYNGDLIYVPKTPHVDYPPQQTTLSRDVPLYDITAVGIRDITPIGKPARLQSLWLGGVNSGIFDGFENANIGAGGLICSEVTCEPHYDNGEVNMYRIQFRFVGSNDGWKEYIYWRDPDTGQPPNDATTSNWSELIQKYSEFDFQTAWPFGDDVGA